MCNLYTYRMTAEDMRLLKSHYNLVGREYLDVLQTRNDEVWPNYQAPVIINQALDERGAILASPKRVIEPMLWGMPAPATAIASTNRRVTNLRNTASAHWKRWLKNPARRCVVPVSRFAEPDGRTSEPLVNRWFRRPDDSLFFFAGIWTEWERNRGTRAKPHVARHRLFGFLTTDPNALVKPVHEKAMPVVLTTPAEVDQWLRAPMGKALQLQKPAADGVLEIIPEEKKAD
jgi:putative SOS response-associated peptidase YedK